MRHWIVSGVLAAALVGVGYDSYRTHKRVTTTEQAVIYLFANTEVKGKDNKPLRRVDLIDLLLTRALMK